MRDADCTEQNDWRFFLGGGVGVGWGWGVNTAIYVVVSQCTCTFKRFSDDI